MHITTYTEYTYTVYTIYVYIGGGYEEQCSRSQQRSELVRRSIHRKQHRGTYTTHIYYYSYYYLYTTTTCILRIYTTDTTTGIILAYTIVKVRIMTLLIMLYIGVLSE